MNPVIHIMGAGGTLGAIIAGLALILAVIIVVKGIRIVQQSEVMIVERLGRYHRTLVSGVNVIIPIMDKPRKIIWRYVIQDPKDPSIQFYKQEVTERIDLREIVFDFPRQNVITKDNVTIQINALIYFQVTDPVRAVYEIQNLPDAIEKLTQTTLRNILGEMDLDESLSSRDHVNGKLTAILDEATDKWGVKVNRVELQDITPPESILAEMEKQMRAERERRAQVLQAEGKKSAEILRAEGQRQSQIAVAEGEQQSQVLRAEGEAQAKIRIAEGDAQAIKTVIQAVGNSSDAVNYLVAMKYLNTLNSIGQSPQKTVFLPLETTGVLGSLGGIRELLDKMGNKPGTPRKIT